MNESEQTPHETRRGWLKNGNPPGDFSKAPRCGAKTRRGTPCQCRAMPTQSIFARREGLFGHNLQ